MESATDTTTEQLMFSLIEVWKTSGKTQKEFCQEKDLAYHKFHYWFRKYNEQNEQKGQAVRSPFISLLPRNSSTPGNLEVVYPDGRRLIFHQAVDASFLRALLG